MKNTRRDFIKLTGLGGFSLISGGVASCTSQSRSNTAPEMPANAPRKQTFNMSGYAAPRMETVKIGFIGLGNRGPGAVERMSRIEGTEIKALCDIRPDKAQAAKLRIKSDGHEPAIYTGNADEWKKLCERDDIDLVYIATPWYLHTPMAVFAMESGKHVCVEVPAATTLEECWQLVETSERTRKHCMMLENACYGFFELLMLNMARQGFFGEIIHVEGAYIHDLLYGNFSKDKYYDLWRLKQNAGRNGNLYPTHGAGPVCQILNINRGDMLDYMVSMSSKDFMMGKLAKELAEKDDFYKPFVNKQYRGNINTSTITTVLGRTIMLQHDVTSPRPKTDGHIISGTKATAIHYPLPPKISIAHEATPDAWRGSDVHEWLSPEEYEALEEKYEPNIVKKLGEAARQVGGHGGQDFLMDWRTIDCLRNGLPLDQDVYDAALWSAIAPLSEWSVANRSTVNVPDFTRGSWKNNKPLDILLDKGANTAVRNVS